MKVIDLIKIVGGYFINLPHEYQVNNFKTDSRDICEGDCFIAINTGHDYIMDAINNKCNCIIVDRHINFKTDIGIIKVDDSVKALAKIARYIRCINNNIPLIAITGSCGKTTTRELINRILSTKYKVLSTNKNENNIIGLSKTLLELNNNYEIALLEMGMNHKDELSKLSLISKPDIAVITNIGSSHIGNLGSIKNIIKAKKEIMDGMSDGVVILNKYDNNSYKFKVNEKNISNRCLDIDYKNLCIEDGRLKCKLIIDDINYDIDFAIPSFKLIENIILAIETCSYFSINMNIMIDAINAYEPINNRMKIYKDKYTVIDDTYNASYESFLASYDYLKTINKLIVIYGDMLELGDYSKKYHKLVNRKLKKLDAIVITTGVYTKYIKSDNHFDSNEDIIKCLEGIDLEGFTIYIKGSHSMHMEEIVKNLIK